MAHNFENIETFGCKEIETPPQNFPNGKSARELSPIERAKTFVLEEKLKAKQEIIHKRNQESNSFNQDLSDNTRSKSYKEEEEVVEIDLCAAERFSS